jgi:hypothetical protein
MKSLLIVFNPFIWMWNNFKYQCHLETYRHSDSYKAYDFSKDIPYFGDRNES